jgi:hypothetical protein
MRGSAVVIAPSETSLSSSAITRVCLKERDLLKED